MRSRRGLPVGLRPFWARWLRCRRQGGRGGRHRHCGDDPAPIVAEDKEIRTARRPSSASARTGCQGLGYRPLGGATRPMCRLRGRPPCEGRAPCISRRSVYGSAMRLRIAYRTSAAGEERLSLRTMAARCVAPVLGLIFNRPVICWYIRILTMTEPIKWKSESALRRS